MQPAPEPLNPAFGVPGPRMWWRAAIGFTGGVDMSSLRDSTADRLIETAVGMSLDRREILSRRSGGSSGYDVESQVLWMVGRLSDLALSLAAMLVRR